MERPSPHRPSVEHLTEAPQQHQHTAAQTPTQVQKFRGNPSRSRPLIQIGWLSVVTNQKSGYQPKTQRTSLNSTIRKLRDLSGISCCSCLTRKLGRNCSRIELIACFLSNDQNRKKLVATSLKSDFKKNCQLIGLFKPKKSVAIPQQLTILHDTQKDLPPTHATHLHHYRGHDRSLP